MYKYTVTAECHFDEKLKDNQKLRDFIFSVETDVLQEYFYHSINHSNDGNCFLSTYDVDFTIDTKKSIYYISFFVYAYTDDLIENFKDIYDITDFDINEIFERCGDDANEIYAEYDLPYLTITNIYPTFTTEKYDNENNDYK